MNTIHSAFQARRHDPISPGHTRLTWPFRRPSPLEECGEEEMTKQSWKQKPGVGQIVTGREALILESSFLARWKS
jgi:hypothetical protein